MIPAMEIIYADSMFLINFIVDYFLLLCAARVSGAAVRRWRIAGAAALGGVYSVAVLLPELSLLSGAAAKLAAALLMSLISYGGEERPARCFVVFLAVSAAFGGAVWGASMLSGGCYGGRIYVPVSLRTLAVSFAVCWAAVSVAFRRLGKRSEREIVPLTVSFLGKSVSVRALRDTGNGLYDPISGRAAAVCQLSALLPLLPAEAADIAPGGGGTELITALAALPGCRGRFTLIPYRAVGAESALLCALRPDSAAVDGKSAAILVAVYPSRLTDDGSYQAII